MKTLPFPVPEDADVLALLRKHFAETSGAWHLHHNGPNRHDGVQVIFPISIHVELDVDGWGVSACDGQVYANCAEGTEVPENIQTGSLEELEHMLEAFKFNLGQSIEEMQRAYRASTGAAHVYVEAS